MTAEKGGRGKREKEGKEGRIEKARVVNQTAGM
jgi:hypothetical protein